MSNVFFILYLSEGLGTPLFLFLFSALKEYPLGQKENEIIFLEGKFLPFESFK